MTSPTDLLTRHPLHDGLAYAERGDRSLLGTLGHWHRGEGSKRVWVRGSQEDCAAAYMATESGDRGMHAAIKDILEPTPIVHWLSRFLSGTGHSVSNDALVTQDVGDVTCPACLLLISQRRDQIVREPGDVAPFEPTDEQIRAAFEAGDPTPADLPDNVIRIVRPEVILDEATETVSFESPSEVVGRTLTITKPIRGGKRSCVTTFADGEAYCGHSESRHNASGSCRSCDCTTFRVEA